MSAKQWKRLDLVKRIRDGELTVGEAARVARLSKRQMRRISKAVRERGQGGVIHGNTGRSPPNRKPGEDRARVVKLFRTKYQGFNDQHFTEKLVEVEGIDVSRATVRRWLRAAGIGAAHRRRPPKHRKRRERMAQAGYMLLWDGSKHDWLEGRGPQLCLVGALDDATGELLEGAHFVDQECAAGYLRLLRDICKHKGVPLCIYMDQHSVFKRNDDNWTLEEEMRGEQDPTQVGYALEELGIEAIYALSPQAKGRVERLWKTLQDRLTSELRLAKARTKDQANAVLNTYRGDHCQRFCVPAAESTPVWVPLHRGQDIDRICSFRYLCTVLNDNTVHLGGLVIDIPPGPGQRSYARAKVDVRQYLDGTWHVLDKAGCEIAAAPATEVGEQRARKRRKRPIASRMFRAAVEKYAYSLP